MKTPTELTSYELTRLANIIYDSSRLFAKVTTATNKLTELRNTLQMIPPYASDILQNAGHKLLPTLPDIMVNLDLQDDLRKLARNMKIQNDRTQEILDSGEEEENDEENE